MRKNKKVFFYTLAFIFYYIFFYVPIFFFFWLSFLHRPCAVYRFGCKKIWNIKQIFIFFHFTFFIKHMEPNIDFGNVLTFAVIKCSEWRFNVSGLRCVGNQFRKTYESRNVYIFNSIQLVLAHICFFFLYFSLFIFKGNWIFCIIIKYVFLVFFGFLFPFISQSDYLKGNSKKDIILSPQFFVSFHFLIFSLSHLIFPYCGYYIHLFFFLLLTNFPHYSYFLAEILTFFFFFFFFVLVVV